MEKVAVIVFSFPEPEDSLTFGLIIDEAKQAFSERSNVKVHAAINDAAEGIMNIINPKESDSNLVAHAKRELELIGEDPDWVKGYLRVIQEVANMGHSGGSASVFIPTLNALLQFKNLKPLTDNPNEWMQVEMGDEECWQNKRNSEAFSNDGGKTYYLLSERGDSERKLMHESEISSKKAD